MKRIILTGGGTAGHVTPNIALLPRLKELQYDIHYIGSYNGIEKELISQFGIPYHGISTGKLRRYFSVQNFTDPFRVIKGMGEARKLIKILEPDVIFSKGGFVSVPVVLAGKGQHVPVIIHEYDSGSCQQDFHSFCNEGLLQLPGDIIFSPGRQGCSHRISDPSGTFKRR